VQSVDERGELRSREPHYTVADRRPSKRILLETLPKQHQARSVPSQDLQPIRSFRAEDENCPRKGIPLKLLARKGCKAVGASAKVHRLCCNQHPHPGRNRDHVAAFTARRAVVNVATSIPGETRTVAAPITISIIAVPPPRWGAIATSGLGRT